VGWSADPPADRARVFLRVVPDNQIAISCYHRAGFTPVSSAEQQSLNKGQPVEYHWMSCVPARMNYLQ
jgi:ribosomal protein S18 acetylase RimI-like enzyme